MIDIMLISAMDIFQLKLNNNIKTLSVHFFGKYDLKKNDI